MVKRWYKRNEPDVVLRGWSLPRTGGVESFSPDVVGRVGLTHGVSQDFWDSWSAQNKDSDLVKNKIVFAAAKAESIRSEAKELKHERMGLEPLDPKTTFKDGEQIPTDPRWPRPISQAELSSPMAIVWM